MKILIINSVCGIRSTGRICADLASLLEKQGHEVKIAYGRENVPKEYKRFAVRIGNRLGTYLHAMIARLFDADGRGSYFATKKFIDWVEEFDPDVIHLHNLHGYYINIGVLFKYIIRNKKKVIWTFHDLWPITGHSCICDYYNCELWETQCKKCPAKSDYPKTIIDKSKSNYLRKKNTIKKVENLTIVTPSTWLAELVKRSYLKSAEIKVIPNGIDTSAFKPLSNDFKRFYNVEDKTVIVGMPSAFEFEKNLNDYYKISESLNEEYVVVLLGLNDLQIRALPNRIIGICDSFSRKETEYIISAADILLDLSQDASLSRLLNNNSLVGPIVYYDYSNNNKAYRSYTGFAVKQGDMSGVVQLLNQNIATMFKSSFLLSSDYEKETQTSDADLIEGFFMNKKSLGLINRTVILGVANPWSSRKGLNDFIRLYKYVNNENTKIVLIGLSEEQIEMLPKGIVGISRTDSTMELAKYYSCADIFMNLTYQDNYPTTNLEAIACKTPVITYKTGGSPESATSDCVAEKGKLEDIISIMSNEELHCLNIDVSKETMLANYCTLYL